MFFKLCIFDLKSKTKCESKNNAKRLLPDLHITRFWTNACDSIGQSFIARCKYNFTARHIFNLLAKSIA